MTHTVLAEKVRKLEEALQNERAMREAALQEERQARERDVRILREALHPFYKSEEEMKRRLLDLEDRVEGNYDEHVRLKDRLIAVDDAVMASEKRLEEVEASKSKRRRVGRQLGHWRLPETSLNVGNHGGGIASPGHVTSSQETSGQTSVAEGEEPRSSGILNLIEYSEPPPYVSSSATPIIREEVRSSGFLEIDLASRIASKAFFTPPPDSSSATGRMQADTPQNPPINLKFPLGDLSSFVKSGVTPPDNATEVQVIEVTLNNDLPKKRKRAEGLMPLHVLANVSAARSIVG